MEMRKCGDPLRATAESRGSDLKIDPRTLAVSGRQAKSGSVAVPTEMHLFWRGVKPGFGVDSQPTPAGSLNRAAIRDSTPSQFHSQLPLTAPIPAPNSGFGGPGTYLFWLLDS